MSSTTPTSLSTMSATSSTNTLMMTTTQTVVASPTPTPPNTQNGNSTIATSASLYLYTFLATLVLLLTVSAAIVVRSFILRRRHRLMVEEAIRNGTWVPPSPPTRPARVDLSKKPVLWEAYVDDKGDVSAWHANAEQTMPHDHWRTDHARDWDTIKPFSAAYVSKPAQAIVAAAALISNSTHTLPTNGLGTSPSTTSVRGGRGGPGDDASANNSALTSSAVANPPTLDEPARVSRPRALFARALRVLSPMPAPTSPLPAPVTSGAGPAPAGQRQAEHAMTELQQRSTAPSMMRVAVLIAMPAPPHASAGAPAPSSADPRVPPQKSRPAPASSDDEHTLPHLEVGVAEVLMVPAESSTPYPRGKREARDSVASRESDNSEV